MRVLPVRLLICLITALLLPAPQVRAEDPTLDLWENQRANFQKYVSHMKPLGRHRIEDVMQIRVEKKALVLRTPLPASDEQQQAVLDGIPGLAMVIVERRQHSMGLDEPEQFTVVVMDYPAPKTSTILSVTAKSQPNELLMITRTVQATNGPTEQVMLTQQIGPQSNEAGMLQLTVTPAGAATEQLNFQSADFFSFLREHPQETARYVRPLLRDLGQEAVFAPEPTIAWQVFGELWKADPMLERRVRELLPLLDAADFHVRDAAQRRLRQLGRDGAAVLMHMDRAKLSPEQNARIDRFLVPYAHLGANEMVRLRSDVGFLLDCLYSDDLPLRRAALERLRAVARPDLQFDVDAGPSARGAAVAALRRQLLPSARRPANELHSAVR